MNQYLLSPNIRKDFFWLIIDISSIRSKKVILALHDHLVLGHSRLEVCNKYNVNAGYLSIKVRSIQDLHKKLHKFLEQHTRLDDKSEHLTKCYARTSSSW